MPVSVSSNGGRIETQAARKDASAVSILVVELLDTAERQLEAARTLNAENLQSSTRKRQDLLFHLELATQDPHGPHKGRIQLSSSDLEGLRRLRAVDQRLQRVLRSASASFELAMGLGTEQTYGASGRLAR